MTGVRRGYVTIGEALDLTADALSGGEDAGSPADRLAAGRAVLRQLLIGGAVEVIVQPRRRKARAVPVALWSTGYATTMFDTGAAEFTDGIGASAGTIKGGVMVARRPLVEALRERSRRADGAVRAGRREIITAFERMDEGRLVSYERGGLVRAAEALAWSFPSHQAATIAGIIRSAYGARRDARGGTTSRPRRGSTAPRGSR